ncbi:uncharacterized protein LOC143327300 [Chaetodon auriga]|uniref:uncharacterized protein LOC143327300 n=1 Tax=Chaetodon auriga TaxID=39042 RepID=UPI0040328D46
MAGNFFGNWLCSFINASVFITGCAVLFVAAFPIAQITLGAVNLYECPAAPAIPVYVMVCGIVALLLMAVFALPRLFCPAALGSRIWILCIFSLVLFVFIWFLFGSYHIYSVYPPNYAKITIDPNNFNNSIYSPSAPDNKPDLSLGNHNQSLPNLNQTWVINSNWTLRNLIQALALSSISSKTDREHLNTSQTHAVMATVPYCDRAVYLFAFWTTTLVYVFAGHALVITVCIHGFMKIGDKITPLLT